MLGTFIRICFTSNVLDDVKKIEKKKRKSKKGAKGEKENVSSCNEPHFLIKVGERRKAEERVQEGNCIEYPIVIILAP